MMYQPTLEDVRYSFDLYPCHSPVSSAIEEIDRDEIFDCLLAKPRKHEYLKMTLLNSFVQYDSSSFLPPHFEMENNTSLIKELTEKAISEEVLEYDVFVKMPPIKEQIVRAKIKSIEKASIHIVEPEEFYGE